MNIYGYMQFIFLVGTESEAALIARDSGSQFTFDITYASLSRLFPVILLADVLLFLVMVVMHVGDGAIRFDAALLIIWIPLTTAIGYLAVLIFIAGLEERIRRARGAPSRQKVLFFGIFSILWFAALLLFVKFILFSGFS